MYALNNGNISGYLTGSTMPKLTQGNMNRIPILAPPLSEQRSIAAVLGALDDKIELNRRMNETLEALAQSLFKSWFVDATQSALPKGWRAGTLGDVIEVKHGFAYQGEFFRDEPCRDILLTPGNFAIGGGFKEDKFKYYEGPTPDEYVLSEGDLLVTMTDLSKAGDTLGYGALLPAAPDGHRFHHNQRLGKVLIRDSDVINKPFLYQILRSHEYRAEILGGATGTTVKHTSPGRIKSFKFVLPPESLMQKFGNVAGAWHELAAHNRKESRTLAALRDALLPKLLSGELRVPAAAQRVEANT
jgi:type I restriction enzyme S subunit